MHILVPHVVCHVVDQGLLVYHVSIFSALPIMHLSLVLLFRVFLTTVCLRRVEMIF